MGVAGVRDRCGFATKESVELWGFEGDMNPVPHG